MIILIPLNYAVQDTYTLTFKFRERLKNGLVHFWVGGSGRGASRMCLRQGYSEMLCRDTVGHC